MWEQTLWVLVSVAGFIVVWLPGLGPGRIKTIANWTGIAIFSIPWFWLPFTAQPRISGVLGIILTIVGILFFIFGLALCRMASRKIFEVVGWAGHAEPSGLVTEGTYGFVRHPIYSGLFMGMFGWSLVWGGVYSIILTPILYLLFRLEAWLEEKLVLEKKFGDAYAAYRKRVPAFFPTILVVPLLTIAILIILGILLGWVPIAQTEAIR